MPGSASSRQPKYRQIADELRRAIQAGDYPPGGALPGENEIMQRYQVARMTARSRRPGSASPSGSRNARTTRAAAFTASATAGSARTAPREHPSGSATSEPASTSAALSS